jgi:hypothetical protein
LGKELREELQEFRSSGVLIDALTSQALPLGIVRNNSATPELL